MPSSAERLIECEVADSVGILTLNQPESRNALTMELRAALRQSLEMLSGDTSVRVIVIAHAGKAFCAGGDVKTLDGQTTATMLKRQHRVQDLIRAIVKGNTPVIAAVDGLALGAGMSIALACDIVVAGEGAKFAAVFGKVGLAPDLGLFWTLPRRVGIGRAELMLLTGRVIGARQAADWGMVDELAEGGTARDAAVAIAREIAANAPLSTALTRRILAQPFSSLDQAMDFEAVTQTLLVGTEDFAEGFAAFREKRPARFKGA